MAFIAMNANDKAEAFILVLDNAAVTKTVSHKMHTLQWMFNEQWKVKTLENYRENEHQYVSINGNDAADILFYGLQNAGQMHQ